MGDILSQDEIDVLLSATEADDPGDGGGADLGATEDATEDATAQRSVTSYDTQAQSVLGFRFFSGNAFLNPAVQAQMGPNDSFAMFRFIAEQGPIPTREATDAYLINSGLEWNLGGWNVTADYTHGKSVTKFAQTQVDLLVIKRAIVMKFLKHFP